MSPLPPNSSKDASLNPIPLAPLPSVPDTTGVNATTTSKTHSAARSNMGTNVGADSQISASVKSSSMAKPTEEITGFQKLPPEIVEDILKKSGAFNSSGITADWSQLALGDPIWRGFADELGLSHLDSEEGQLHTAVAHHCTAYVKMIATLSDAKADVKALAKGPLNLETMLKLQEWKGNRDKIAIMRKLAQEVGLESPDASKLSTIDGMIQEGKKLSSWIETNKNSLNVRELYLNRLQLTTLPEEIGHLTSMTRLVLEDNLLTSLPAWIGQLHELQFLNLSVNRLLSLPPEIGQLEQLSALDLSANSLTSLPDQIGELINLKTLYIEFNKITSLPPSIGRLEHLNEFMLRSNALESLPQEIGQLKELEILELENNLLPRLPASIGQLTNLNRFALSDNRLNTLRLGNSAPWNYLGLKAISLHLFQSKWRNSPASICFCLVTILSSLSLTSSKHCRI